MLAVLIAMLTWFAGWWTVAGVALLWGIIAERHTRPALTVGFAAAVGWLLLLIVAAVQGPVWMLAYKLAGILGLPGPAVIGLALLFPGLLALSAGALGGELKQIRG